MAAKENLGAERKRKIAVTGNQGYIGSVLTRLLIEAGYKVVGIDAGRCANGASTAGHRPNKKGHP